MEKSIDILPEIKKKKRATIKCLAASKTADCSDGTRNDVWTLNLKI